MDISSLFSESSLKFVETYLNNNSPTGFETPGQKLWLDYIRPYIDAYEVDAYGTVFGIINPDQPYKVVIEAHADEIAWFVNHITDNGFIYVIRNGGSDHQIAPSKRVIIHTDEGKVPGVFGWPAIHTRKGPSKEEGPSLKNIFIDVGCQTKAEVEEMGIKVGHVITFDDQFTTLNNKYFVGRALDNRLGGFMIAEVARLLKENAIQLPYSLYVVNAVQEEIGLRGAQMVAERIQPDAAIITDVTHDTHTPMIDPKQQGSVKSGKGPSLTIAPAVQNNLLKLIMGAAAEKEIPYQREASSRATGTDTDAFAYSNKGVPSALISLPLRYMHTTVEMAHAEDIHNVIQLIYHSLQRITQGHDFRYFS